MTVRKFLSASQEFQYSNNVFYQKAFNPKKDFEESYIKIRKQEGRVYDDSTIFDLPNIPHDHPLSKEWKVRAKSAHRLANYLRSKKNRLIMEVGCGNGWLSSLIASQTGAEVLGLDVNETELQQAARIFRSGNLAFAFVDVLTQVSLPMFESIVLASSIQYFQDLGRLLSKLKQHLCLNGEIHIIDTPFYSVSELDNARERSRQYFKTFNVKNDFYFHHSWNELKDFDYSMAFDPNSVTSRLKKMLSPDSPFPWIIIRK